MREAHNSILCSGLSFEVFADHVIVERVAAEDVLHVDGMTAERAKAAEK